VNLFGCQAVNGFIGISAFHDDSVEERCRPALLGKIFGERKTSPATDIKRRDGILGSVSRKHKTQFLECVDSGTTQLLRCLRLSRIGGGEFQHETGAAPGV
jgi:hypothetical protein